MKKILLAALKLISVPIAYIAAIVLYFWWLYLIMLAYGAYQTAAKAWGWYAGIISVLLAFVLPVSSFILWCCAFSKDPNGIIKEIFSSKKTAEGTTASTTENKNKYTFLQKIYLKLLSSMMAKMAKADGHIDVNEIRAAEQVFERLGFAELQKRMCVGFFRGALLESHTIRHYATKMVTLKFSHEMRIQAYEVLWEIAIADGVLSPEEKVLLKELERWLNFAPGTYDRYYRQYTQSKSNENYRREQYQDESAQRDDLLDAYDELGCSPESSDEELKLAYRSLAKRLHPDVLKAQGMPDSLIGRANMRMAQINAAWDKIRKARDIR